MLMLFFGGDATTMDHICLGSAVQSHMLILQMQGTVFTGEILAMLQNHCTVHAELPVWPELSWGLNF